MKYLKYLLYILLGIIALYLILCGLGTKDLNISESIEINAPAPVVFHLSNSAREMETWNAWAMTDTTITTTFNDIEEGVGSASSWTSELSGNGTQKIIETIPSSKVKTELTFEGWSGVNYAEIDINQTGNKSNATWSFTGTPLPFLMRGFALVTGMKKMMQTNYRKGLEALKKIAEQRAKGIYDGYTIMEKEMEEKHFIMNRQQVNAENIQQFYASNLGALFAKVQKAGAEMNGMPCGLYFKRGGNNAMVDMAAAIPLATPLSIEGAASYSIPAQNSIVLDFYGDYTTISKGHKVIEKFMKDRGYLQDPPVIEEYITDPTTETDPNKWLTKITYYFSLSQQ